ncbi:MAG: hypothetical protein COB02_03460 [Candidatus Cloacimonadota bacterium]|nr:MAG: hypothetical protein COB02_03460 [Candidatus Cloacimonadota bacterium]
MIKENPSIFVIEKSNKRFTLKRGDFSVLEIDKQYGEILFVEKGILGTNDVTHVIGKVKDVIVLLFGRFQFLEIHHHHDMVSTPIGTGMGITLKNGKTFLLSKCNQSQFDDIRVVLSETLGDVEVFCTDDLIIPQSPKVMIQYHLPLVVLGIIVAFIFFIFINKILPMN